MANLNLNKVIIGGRLTADPELKSTPSGASVVSFVIAVTRKYTAANGERETDFITCTAWRQTAEFVAGHFKKGSSICLVGSIQTRTWTDKNGDNRWATDVICDEAYFVDSKAESERRNAPEGLPSQFTGAQLDQAMKAQRAAIPKPEMASADEADLPF